MSKRSINPWAAIIRIRRQMMLLELKHKFAVEDNRLAEQERLTRKAEGLMERLAKMQAMAALQVRRCQEEAMEINEKLKSPNAS